MVGTAFSALLSAPASSSFRLTAPRSSLAASCALSRPHSPSILLPASPSFVQQGASRHRAAGDAVAFALQDLAKGKEDHEAFIASLSCTGKVTETLFAPVEEKLYEFRLRSKLSRREEEQSLQATLQPLIVRALILLTILQVASQLVLLQAKNVIITDTKVLQAFPVRVIQAVLGIRSKRLRKFKTGCVETFWC
ncbi:hypothetical protein GUITHDRAFT_151083 [Guillardia theta CCMP2712]|uniref:Uncharacterized protein n=1 Tax=Guillardia theta (strain CCMP2712) TaxID=905079 RepID=L1JRD8_GUITC|nr:hypothetical protein GUITHDRAFT_151083 [Guillardia theta CCMP2712]EKX50834.1 hypothetical protein GUITHDRAFT_151083 [Guillardia theta CCMP2712]|eukprot:XP_005837814.1 hypothetical protein GUITHDRAFT_151083 [Guillardia theta CCMP2712]